MTGCGGNEVKLNATLGSCDCRTELEMKQASMVDSTMVQYADQGIEEEALGEDSLAREKDEDSERDNADDDDASDSRAWHEDKKDDIESLYDGVGEDAQGGICATGFQQNDCDGATKNTCSTCPTTKCQWGWTMVEPKPLAGCGAGDTKSNATLGKCLCKQPTELHLSDSNRKSTKVNAKTGKDPNNPETLPAGMKPAPGSSQKTGNNGGWGKRI